MNRVNWTTLGVLAAGLLLMPGCSGFGNPPPEPMGLALEEMRRVQTQNPEAGRMAAPLRLDGEKAQQVITGYRGQAQSAPGIAGDINISIGN